VSHIEKSMARLSFRELPLAVRLAVGLTFVLTWVFIEEHIIEPFGFWKYMPFYKVGNFCVYDLTVGLIIIGCIWRFSSGAGPPAVTRAE